MPERHFLFLVVLIIIINGEVFSQIKYVEKPRQTPFSSLSYNELIVKKKFYTVQAESSQKSIMGAQKNPLNASLFFHQIPYVPNLSLPSMAVSSLTFFCKNELKFERLSGLPLRFRLGSLAYVDYLERKPNSLTPNR